ncbi:hypothetical protein Sar04_00750 [Salinispora arenicola]|uniref:Uncharacterized protein n=1 Tax=Salinispora arenicola TaxID=168697 RepID=A0ABQ4JMW0_SALAC|nr:hypothetical protein Sar04_00750 [Salinispora arenicola]
MLTVLVVGGGAAPGIASLQGRTDPVSPPPGAAPVTPDVRGRQTLPVSSPPCWWLAPWKGSTMSNKPKPDTTDEAREQLRRALQTSMDTRQ